MCITIYIHIRFLVLQASHSNMFQKVQGRIRSHHLLLPRIPEPVGCRGTWRPRTALKESTYTWKAGAVNGATTVGKRKEKTGHMAKVFP